MADIIAFIVRCLTGAAIMAVGYYLGKKDGKEAAVMTIRYDLRAKIEKASIIEFGASVTEIQYDPLHPDDIRIKGEILKPIKEFSK
mgnify:CR=1 FL=1